MDRVKIQQLAFAAFFLVVFNVLFFLLLGDKESTAGWISYAFVHGAFLVMLVTFFVGGKHNQLFVSLDSPCFTGMIFFVFMLLLGLLFTFVTPNTQYCILVLTGTAIAFISLIIRAYTRM